MLNLNTTIKSIETLESGELKIVGKASTPSVDRVKDVILSDAWMKGGLDNYRKNPILLFNHNYDEPIGKVVRINVSEEGLEVEGTVYQGSKAYALIERGVLKTFSVGFMIKDADYNRATDGLIVKDAELLEISVVSVPCNQDAVFELSKSFSLEEFETMKKKFGKKSSDEDAESASDTNKMTKEELDELMKKAVSDALAKSEADRVARETELAQKAAAEAEAKKKAEEVETTIRASVEKTVSEKVNEAVTTALETSAEETTKIISEMRNTISDYQEELKTIREARGGFFPDKGASNRKDFLSDPETKEDAIHAYILGKALGTSPLETSVGKQLVEKVNALSSIQVSSDSFEQLVSTEIFRDIELQLVLAPLFREVTLRSASQLLTIAPDTGYATHQASGSTLPGTKPNGLLNDSAGAQPYALTEQTLRTDKLVSKAYLANDTEEDAILPLLPIIRDSMVRQHAKSVDQMILTAGVVGSTFPNMVSKGLINYAATSGRTVEGPALNGTLTSAHLLAARAAMGKYGISPADLVMVVGVKTYNDLLQDSAFYDNYQVGEGTKVTGEVGRMFGTRILVSSEMPDTTAANNIAALLVNTRNFLVPRLRGMTSESEYDVDGQHWLLATTQRLGFQEMIPNAPAVVAVDYAAA